MQRLSYTSTPRLDPYTYSSVVDVLHANATKFPNREILIHRRENGNRISITNEELDAKSSQFAKYLCSTGLNRGSSVAILGPNTIEWVIAEFSILKAGGVSVHLSLGTTEAEDAMDILIKAKCTKLIIEPGINMEMKKSVTILIQKVMKWNKENSDEISIVQLRSIPGLEHVPCLNEILHMDLQVKLPFIFPEDPSVVFTTSGSTGSPKMILYSHFSLANLGSRLSDIMASSTGTFYNDRPFIWIGGTPLLYAVLNNTARVFTDTTVSIRGTNTEYIWNAIKEENCMGALTTPFLLQDLFGYKESKNDNFLLPLLILSGQIIDDRYRKAIGLVCKRMVISYATTEGGSTGYTVEKNSPIQTGFCGKPRRGIELKVINSAGNPVFIGEQGEVCVRSRLTSQGIFNDPTGNKKLFLDGDWMRLGDIGYINNNGDLVITGRSKDIIVRGTRKVLPSMIENVIKKKMTGLREVVVVPVPDKRLFEEVCVCFTTNSDADTITADDVRSLCEEIFIREESLDSIGESPTYFLKVDKIPMLETGKIDKHSLTEFAVQQLDLS